MVLKCFEMKQEWVGIINLLPPTDIPTLLFQTREFFQKYQNNRFSHGPACQLGPAALLLFCYCCCCQYPISGLHRQVITEAAGSRFEKKMDE